RSIDTSSRSLELEDGQSLHFGALLLAIGSRPVRLEVPGADLPHVHLLRSLEDSRRIIQAAESAGRAVVVGASFIGMEVAASLRKRGLKVAVVAPDATPFERTMGAEIGRVLQMAHEAEGVHFYLGRTTERIESRSVVLN